MSLPSVSPAQCSIRCQSLSFKYGTSVPPLHDDTSGFLSALAASADSELHFGKLLWGITWDGVELGCQMHSVPVCSYRLVYKLCPWNGVMYGRAEESRSWETSYKPFKTIQAKM